MSRISGYTLGHILDAAKHVYYLNHGKEYDRVALDVIRAFKRGGPDMVVSYLKSPELYADPAAKIMREYLGIRVQRPNKALFFFCQPKVGGGAPEWGGNHGWRVRKWPEFSPYIHPTYKDTV